MKTSLRYDHYYLYDELCSALQGFAEKNPRYARLTVIGKSYEGRDIYLMEITDTVTGDYAEKPAFYSEGNLHAGEVTGSMTVLYEIDTLLTNHDEPEIARLLDRYTFYLLPRVSPDGSELYLTSPDTVRSSTRMYPYEKAMPGLYAKDMDGDGAIRSMRVRSHYGCWKESPDDSRLMIARRPDEDEGIFYNVYTEGEIADYDGLNIRPAQTKNGYDFNRNYPIHWEPERMQRGAGEKPLASPETQANAEFLLTHPNIAFCVDMHTSGGQILYTPGYESAKKADPADIALYRSIGKLAQEESGYPLLNVYDDYSAPNSPVTYGGFDDFCHFIIGIPAYTIECWDLKARAGIDVTYPPKEISEEERRTREVKILKWIDENIPAEEGFQPWTPFDHPQLGEVEIGGINRKFIEQNPPKSLLEQECAKHTRFMLRAVKTLPRLAFDSVCTVRLSESLWQIRAVIGNRGYMPTYVFKEGLKNPSNREITAVLSGSMEIIEGKAETALGHLNGFSSAKATSRGLPGTTAGGTDTCREVSWVIRASEGTVLTLTAAGGHAGKISTSVILS